MDPEQPYILVSMMAPLPETKLIIDQKWNRTTVARCICLFLRVCVCSDCLTKTADLQIWTGCSCLKR